MATRLSRDLGPLRVAPHRSFALRCGPARPGGKCARNATKTLQKEGSCTNDARVPSSGSLHRSVEAVGLAASAMSAVEQVLNRVKRTVASAHTPAAYGSALLFFGYLWWQPLMSYWAFYCSLLDSHPLLTKVVTGIVGTLLGDYLAQSLTHEANVGADRQRGEPATSFSYDVARGARMAVYSALIGTPIGHAWFLFLDTRVMPEAMTSAPAVISKMVLDQALMCLPSTALWLVVMRCWEGHPQDSLAYMRAKIAPALAENYKLWPVAHLFNFYFVPPEQRILFCNVINVFWSARLSSLANDRSQEDGTAAATAGGSSSATLPASEASGDERLPAVFSMRSVGTGGVASECARI